MSYMSSSFAKLLELGQSQSDTAVKKMPTAQKAILDAPRLTPGEILALALGGPSNSKKNSPME